MAAGAAMAVVGWWSGYKLGGVISLFTADYFEKIGIENYWQINIFNFRYFNYFNEYWINVCSKKNLHQRD